MKTVILFLLMASFLVPATAQKVKTSDVPAPVATAFHKKFSAAEKVKWEMDEENYEASFTINKMKKSAVFDANGMWMETETELDLDKLPHAVSGTVAKQFADYKIKEGEKVESKDGVSYEVELAKGKEILEVAISDKGAVLEQKTKEGNDKEDSD